MGMNMPWKVLKENQSGLLVVGQSMREESRATSSIIKAQQRLLSKKGLSKENLHTAPHKYSSFSHTVGITRTVLSCLVQALV